MDSQKMVLVVEDELPLQKAVVEKFTRQGVNVQAATNIDAAMEIIKLSKHIDLIWLDHYLLGSGTGLDLVEKLKEHDQWRNIPVVVVSNTASAQKLEEYRQHGVSNCYIKSEYSLGEIFDRVQQMMAK